MRGLHGRSIVVTGASSGIGEGIAERLAAVGAHLTLGSRTAPQVSGDNVHWIQTDVAEPGQADALIAGAVERFGQLDGLVNNAGVQIEKTIADTSDDEFDLVIGVNVRGVFNCSRAAVRSMQQGSGGSIVNIGSIAGDTADHGMAIYNASKGAVHAMTRAIATDHGADGIRCNAVAPGWVATALAEAAFELADDPAAAREHAVSAHPVGRLGTPADIANIVAWLLSDEAGFTTGSVFRVDGGLTAGSPI